MRKRTIKQIDAQIKKIERRLNQLKADRALIALGIEPRNQLSFFTQLTAKQIPEQKRAEQLQLI